MSVYVLTLNTLTFSTTISNPIQTHNSESLLNFKRRDGMPMPDPAYPHPSLKLNEKFHDGQKRRKFEFDSKN